MKYFIIAGEPSGDLHGANLMRAILQKDAQAEFQYFGGDNMASVAGKPIKHVNDLSIMGFWEVLKGIFKIMKFFRAAKKAIKQFQPDVIVPIDYPGFNLRMAKYATRKGFQVAYYISPQVWAWKASRVKKIKKFTDLMMVIFPFEVDFYKTHGHDVKFVGHPLLDVISEYRLPSGLRKELEIPDDKTVIALLPGSRKQEISRMLPIMTSVSKNFPSSLFLVAGINDLESHAYSQAEKLPNVQIVYGRTYDILNTASAGLITSGTATLEAALHNVPQIICYKANPLSYIIGKMLVKVKFIGIVNLILERKAFRELIQGELTSENLTEGLMNILKPDRRSEILGDYNDIRNLLGKSGASEKAADEILSLINSSN